MHSRGKGGGVRQSMATSSARDGAVSCVATLDFSVPPLAIPQPGNGCIIPAQYCTSASHNQDTTMKPAVPVLVISLLAFLSQT